MDDDNGNPFSNHVVILLIAMGSAAFVVSMYHVIAICWCNQRMARPNTPPHQPPPAESTPSVADMIPIHTYHKKKVDHTAIHDDSDDNNGMCAVCLGDYEEGEELKTMPECMHSFHVPCIDMWLSSHSSCPVCRSSATPSLEVLHSEHDHFDYAYQHSIDMTQFVNGFVMRR